LKDLEALATPAERRELRRGEVLVRQGEPSDVLYIVLSGRFTVQVEGVAEPVAEIGQGQPVGEIGFFAERPRTATVAALRDASVLAFTRERFRQISDASPSIRDAIILWLARRLAENVGPVVRDHIPIRTVALLSAGGSHVPEAFVETLQQVFGSAGRVAFLTATEVAAQAPGGRLDDPRTSTWLNAREADADFVFFVAEPTLTDWTRTCVRQADALLLAAVAGSSTELNPSERFAFSVHARRARRLVLLHRARASIVTGTHAWLDERDVFMHHHVALTDAADVHRIYRFLSGRALGFVASGGGALASAHLGAYKAFRDAGADFDILGGTSAGAALMAGLAFGVEPERVDQGIHNIFVRDRAFRRPTLPVYGLLNHKAFDRALRAEYGDAAIEDLWRPFYAVSSSLSDQQTRIHTRGPVWRAVRASGSLPGVLPPFFTPEGEMLVDGALMDNVPLDVMQALKAGPNVVVALKMGQAMRYGVEYDAIPGPVELGLSLLNPFSGRRRPPVPGILQVIGLSMLANSQPGLTPGDMDILIRPDLPPDARFTAWERHTEIFLHAYRSVAAWIQARIAAADPAVQAVIRVRCLGVTPEP
jgi:NTE family protein